MFPIKNGTSSKEPAFRYNFTLEPNNLDSDKSVAPVETCILVALLLPSLV